MICSANGEHMGVYETSYAIGFDGGSARERVAALLACYLRLACIQMPGVKEAIERTLISP